MYQLSKRNNSNEMKKKKGREQNREYYEEIESLS